MATYSLTYHKYTSDCPTPEVLEWANEDGVYLRDIRCPGHPKPREVEMNKIQQEAESLGKCVICKGEAVVLYPLLPKSPAFCKIHYTPECAEPYGVDFSASDYEVGV